MARGWPLVVALAGCDLAGRVAVDEEVSDLEGDADGDAAPGADPDDPKGGGPEATGDPDPEGFVWPDGLDVRVCGDGTADYTELQPAIDAAAGPVVIGVCPGTYGPIEVPSFADVELVGPGPALATIDGGEGTAVYVRSSRLVLEGFTLTGTGQDLDWKTDLGGAITTQEGDLVVRDCVVTGVTGPYALVFDEEYLVVEDVVWEDNATDWLWFLYQGTSATFTRNTVRRGTHQTVLATPDLTGLTLTNSTFADLTIDTAFTAFSFTGRGEGELVVANNVFWNVDDLDPWGGRLVGGAADFRNNVVVGCDAWDLDRFPSSYSIFWDNGVDYGPFVNGTDNVFADPLLADPASGDFSLLAGSPAIDAGDPSNAYQDRDGTRNDMGAGGGPSAQ